MSLAFGLAAGIALLAIVVLVITLIWVRPWDEDNPGGGGGADTRPGQEEERRPDEETGSQNSGGTMLPGAEGGTVFVSLV